MLGELLLVTLLTSTLYSQADASLLLKQRNDANGRWIVQLRDWEHIGKLRDTLERLTGFHYAAVPHPAEGRHGKSDFVVMRSKNGSTEHLRRSLRSAQWVSSVFEDREVVAKQTEESASGYNASSTAMRPGSRGLKSLKTGRSAARAMGAESLWQEGLKGQGIKVAVFDTGIRSDHPYFKHIDERTNWTKEKGLSDGLGHGTYVAGVIASQDEQCPGFAPEAEILTFRVFTNDQTSYTSWFLDAFNHAMEEEIDLLNLSIGGPDNFDRPFVEKIRQMTASGICMVSAIGNDGPHYGTLNNPADQPDVLGVGAITFDKTMASFSSRGMTTWELPRGYGRIKPDVVAPGRSVLGPRISGGCRSLSGTSVASPVATGAAALVASAIPTQRRGTHLNPGSLKQALVESALPITSSNMFEHGGGMISLQGARSILANYTPRASAFPRSLEFGTGYSSRWPFDRQPLYTGAQPVVANVTIINGMHKRGWMEAGPTFVPSNAPAYALDVRFEHNAIFWPWSGSLAVFIKVKESARHNASGVAEGMIRFTLASPSPTGSGERQLSSVDIPLRSKLIPTPERRRRILWDQFHNVAYPPAYIPRDSLDIRNDALDWHGDHPHTNFHDVFDMLVDKGYVLEVLGSPLTCFDAKEYGALMIVDPEEEFSADEAWKLRRDVEEENLALLIFADWYNSDFVDAMRFFDDSTQLYWYPETGGANLPALNFLLSSFGISFSSTVADGKVSILGTTWPYKSGTTLRTFPRNGTIVRQALERRTSPSARGLGQPLSSKPSTMSAKPLPIMGLYHVAQGTSSEAGRVFVYGDSSCLDSGIGDQLCLELLRRALSYAVDGEGGEDFKREGETFVDSTFSDTTLGLPRRTARSHMANISKTLQGDVKCGTTSAYGFHDLTERAMQPNLSVHSKLEEVGNGFSSPSVAKQLSPRKAAGDEQDTEMEAQESGARGQMLLGFSFLGLSVVGALIAGLRRLKKSRWGHSHYKKRSLRGGLRAV